MRVRFQVSPSLLRGARTPLKGWVLGVAAILLVPAAPALPACDSAGTAVGSSATACTIALPQPPDWRLHTDGMALKDGLGRVVTLRGVDGGGRSKFAPYMPFDYDASSASDFDAKLAAYIQRAASWGIDSMRVPFTWAALEPTQGSYDSDWIGRYQKLLAAAWSAGIWTIVDFHQDVYSECFCGDGFPCWTITDPPAPAHDCPTWSLEYFNDTGVQKAFDAFWASGSPVQAQYLAAWDVMLSHFAGQPGVLGFEPINEPAAGTANANTFEATTLTDFFTRMIAHFHAHAPSSLVFVDATGLDGAVNSTNLNRPVGDFVFAPHNYPVAPVAGGVQNEITTWATLGKKWNVPVWVGEFGTLETSSLLPPYSAAHWAAFDSLGVSGSEWEYSVSTQEWNSEKDSVVAADGTEYPVVASIARPFARAVAGSDITQSWAADPATFTLKWTPTAAGVTEISLPARAFPNGYQVSLTGGCYDAKSVPGRLLVQSSTAAPTTLIVSGPASP